MDRRRARARPVGGRWSTGAVPAPEAIPLALAAVGLIAMLALVAPVSVLGATARGITFAATLAAIGICVFARLAHDGAGPPGETLALRRVVLGAALAGVAASFLWLGVETADVSGRGLGGLADSTSLDIVARNGAYASAVLRSLGLAFIAYATAARWRAPTAGPLVAFGAVLACAWCMLTGHPATHGPSALVHAMTFLHMAAGAVWFGGLVALAIVMRHRRRTADLAGAAAVVESFSRLMGWTMAALLTGGTVIAWAFVGSLGRLTATSYGLVLLAKVGLVLSVLAVGGFNRRRLVPAVAAGQPRGWRMLGRTVVLEQAALVGVLALTAVLVNLDPHG